jgi:hypothetical protein
MIDRVMTDEGSLGKLFALTRANTLKGVFHAGFHHCRSTLHHFTVYLAVLHLVCHHRYRLCDSDFHAALPEWVPIA